MDPDRVAYLEEAGAEACRDLFRRAGLPVPEDPLALDCETECPLHDACPLWLRLPEGKEAKL